MLKKKMLFLSVLILLSLALIGQSKKYDSLAILIVDRMADVIGDLEGCSFKLNTVNDVAEHGMGLVKYFSEFEVFMNGPTKMLVNSHGHKGHRTFMYNGDQLAYYSFDENNYGILPAPGNLISMMDSINDVYGIEFPAADFFYPAFTDDLLLDADSLRFLGIEQMGNKEYFHIMAYSKERDFQFWINNDAYTLPARFAITYKSRPGSPQYLALFSDWQINPKLPDAMFDFLPPPGANRIRFLAKNEK